MHDPSGVRGLDSPSRLPERRLRKCLLRKVSYPRNLRVLFLKEMIQMLGWVAARIKTENVSGL